MQEHTLFTLHSPLFIPQSPLTSHPLHPSITTLPSHPPLTALRTPPSTILHFPLHTPTFHPPLSTHHPPPFFIPNCPLLTLHSPLFIPHSPLPPSTLHSTFTTLHFPLSTLHSLLTTPHPPLTTLHSPLSTLHFPLPIPHSPLPISTHHSSFPHPTLLSPFSSLPTLHSNPPSFITHSSFPTLFFSTHHSAFPTQHPPPPSQPFPHHITMLGSPGWKGGGRHLHVPNRISPPSPPQESNLTSLLSTLKSPQTGHIPLPTPNSPDTHSLPAIWEPAKMFKISHIKREISVPIFSRSMFLFKIFFPECPLSLKCQELGNAKPETQGCRSRPF